MCLISGAQAKEKHVTDYVQTTDYNTGKSGGRAEIIGPVRKSLWNQSDQPLRQQTEHTNKTQLRNIPTHMKQTLLIDSCL